MHFSPCVFDLDVLFWVKFCIFSVASVRFVLSHEAQLVLFE